jgi:hypothetical protein
MTWINFDETDTSSVYSSGDEWVDLEAYSATPTNGWHLRSHLTLIRYSVPDTVRGMVRVWTHRFPAGAQEFSLNLPDSVWAWSNDTPDYIELLDSSGTVVDTMHYGD